MECPCTTRRGHDQKIGPACQGHRRIKIGEGRVVSWMTTVIPHRHLESTGTAPGNLLPDIAQPQDPQFLVREHGTWLPGLSPLALTNGGVSLRDASDNGH